MEERELLLKIGARIKEIRVSKGVTQQQLAVDAFNSDKSSISRIESGKVNVSIFTLHKIADYLQVSLSDLVAI